MVCKECIEKAVIILPENAKKLCKNHFIEYFETKVFHTIAEHKLLQKQEHIVVALSGGKDSMSTLYLLHKLSERNPKITLSALLIDEGIAGYRPKTIEDAKNFCKEKNIPLHIASFKELSGYDLDEILKKRKIHSCAICGVFRRALLNEKARELHATKLATGHNLDDEAQSIFMNQITVNVQRSKTLGPITKNHTDERFIPRIKPLFFMTEKEITIYSLLKGFPVTYVECPYAPQDNMRNDVRIAINTLEEKHPGTKHGLVNTFLKNTTFTKEHPLPIGVCKECKEPCSADICKKCEYLKKIK